MKKSIVIIAICLSAANSNYAQLQDTSNLAQAQDTWDIPATETMISQNKKQYKSHKEIKNNQTVSQATVLAWNKSTNELKSLSDFIDKRLTSAFIVITDVSTLYNIYGQLKEMIKYEKMSLEIIKRHPWTAPYMVSQQANIIKDGNDVLNYISLLIMSYGDISKMKVSNRQIIFHGLDLQVAVLKARCYSMYSMMKRLDIASEIRKTGPMKMINRDHQLVKDILNKMK